MFRFFRTLRQKLLTQNRFSKYLLYAVGEILLVVVGILIALQIDQWKEATQNEEKVAKLLAKIQRDIEVDVATITETIPYYAEKDSIIYLILNDRLTPEDYKNPDNWKLHDIVFDLKPMVIKRVGYDNLRDAQDMIPTEYDSIVDQLIYQYDEVLKIFEKTHDFLLEDARKNEEYMFRNHDWFSNPMPNHLNEERIEYFVNDVRYKGMARNYQDASTDEYIVWASRYLEAATNNYEAISTILGKNPGKPIYDSTTLDKRFLGDYKLVTGDTITAFMKNGRFYIQGSRLNALFPYGRNKLFTRNNYLRFDSQGDSLYTYTSNYQAGSEPVGVKID